MNAGAGKSRRAERRGRGSIRETCGRTIGHTKSSWYSTHSRVTGESRLCSGRNRWTRRHGRSRQTLLAGLDRLMSTPPPDPPRRAGSMRQGRVPRRTYLLRRGDYTARGPEMAPAFPAVLSTGASAAAAAPRASSARRADAAVRWRIGWFALIIR